MKRLSQGRSDVICLQLPLPFEVSCISSALAGCREFLARLHTSTCPVVAILRSPTQFPFPKREIVRTFVTLDKEPKMAFVCIIRSTCRKLKATQSASFPRIPRGQDHFREGMGQQFKSWRCFFLSGSPRGGVHPGARAHGLLTSFPSGILRGLHTKETNGRRESTEVRTSNVKAGKTSGAVNCF